MSKTRIIGYAFLGVLLGALAGGGLGLAGGLVYTSLAGVSGFEGYSGFVVIYWLIAGVIFGLIGGCLLGVKLGRSR